MQWECSCKLWTLKAFRDSDDRTKMMSYPCALPLRSALAAAFALSSILALAGCAGETTADIIERHPLPLRGEHVLLTPEQVRCGEKAKLWTIVQVDGGGARARLERDGQVFFADDVRMGEQRYRGPVAPLAGDFPVKVKKIREVTPDGPSVQVVAAELGVILNHSCFTKQLPLLGIADGDFSLDAPPRIRLREHNGWTADTILH